MCQQVPTVPGDPCANGCQWVPTNKRVPTGADIKTTNAQFAKPQMHILQSNRSVQSTAEASCPPCSVAVALMATGDASLFRDLCSNSVCLRTSRKPI